MSERKLDSNQDGNCNCNVCEDTGYYGNNGPGTSGNAEYVECECQSTMSETAEENKSNSLLNLGKQILDLSEDQKRLLREAEIMACKRYAQSQLQELREENKKLREGLALNQGDVARKKMLLEELGQAASDEIVDKENGNYLKLKVDDIPEDFIWYMD